MMMKNRTGIQNGFLLMSTPGIGWGGLLVMLILALGLLGGCSDSNGPQAASVSGGKDYFQPAGLFDASSNGYSQVVTSRPGTFFYVAGLGAYDGTPEFNVVGETVAEQFVQVGINLDAALAGIGAQRTDVTMIRIYIVGYQNNQLDPVTFEPILNGDIVNFLSDFFPEGQRPATSWIGVEGLSEPRILVEAEIQGIIPDSP